MSTHVILRVLHIIGPRGSGTILVGMRGSKVLMCAMVLRNGRGKDG
jgi:hypothetical protein